MDLSILPFNNCVPAIGHECVIMTWKGGLNGSFDWVLVDPVVKATRIQSSLQYNNVTGAGNLMFTCVPEPTMFPLLTSGTMALWYRWQRPKN